MTITHTFKPYTDNPDLCVEELPNGDTCNHDQSAHRPRIDIVVMRDPDSETSLMVFLDGVQIAAKEWHFDPGAGYSEEEWEEMRQEDLQAAPGFLRDTLDELYDEFGESEYVG